MRGRGKLSPAAAALGLQALSLGLLSAFVALSGLFLPGKVLPFVHGGGMWAGQCLLCACTACRCALKGVPAIGAWPLASICFIGVYCAIVALPPSTGACALAAVCGLVAASGGEVVLRRRAAGKQAFGGKDQKHT